MPEPAPELDLAAFNAALRPAPPPAPPPSPRQEPAPEPQPPPTQGLSLLGVIRHDDPVALLYDELSGVIVHARVGDAPRPGLTLARLEPQRVLFTHARLGDLWLEVPP